MVFRGPLDQNSNFLFVWDSLHCIAIHASYVLVWFQAAIDASISWHLVIIYILDFLYLLYVLSQFVTSYKVKGKPVKSYKQIGIKVMKVIILDILSLFPLEVFAASQLALTAAYFRLNRSLRFFRVYQFYDRMESNIMTSSFLWASIKALSVSLVSMHLWSCVWYMIACDNISDGGYCTPDTWANTDNLDYGINMNGSGPYRRYLASYYWSITTITTVGYGEIHPQNWRERLVALICMIVECTKLSIILGKLAALLTNKEIKVSAFKYHLKIVQEHMLNMTLPETLRKRVVDRYEHIWKQSKGEEIEKLLLVLPPNLQTALFTETHQGMLAAVLSMPIYKDEILIATQFMQRNSVHYLRQLSQMIVAMIYLPGEVILKKGEFGDSLYYLQRGHIEVVDGTGQIKHLIQSGETFGKINLLFKTISTVTLRAGSLCELAILPASNFHILEKYYPIIGLQLRTTLRAQFVECCAHAKESLKSYNPENSSLAGNHAAEDEKTCRNMFEDVENNRSSKKQSALWRLIRKFIDITITPGSKFYVFWNGFMFITILITVWIYCYLAAFTRFKPSIGYENHRVEFVFTYLIDLVFIVDMIVSMKVAYEGADAIVIDQPWSVFKHYVRNWKFILDVSAILPIEMFSLVWNDPWNYIALYKLNRILKWWRLWHILEDDLSHSVRVSSSKIHFLRMLVYIPTITHVGACMWFVLACFHEGRCLKDSWAQQQGISINNSALHDYVISLYWSTTTMTTVGYGDITPYNDGDKILAIIAMIVGTLLYGYILGAVAATLTSAFASKVAFQERLTVVKDFVAQHTANKHLFKRIYHHYNLLWKQSRGESNYIAVLLSNLPENLREEVLLSDLQETIENIPWFAKADPKFLKKLASIMTLHQYSPGDFIMCHGDIYNEMYCVRKGMVEVLSEDLSHVVAKIGLGGYFGELSLLGRSRSIITARAATHCEVLGIDRVELENILKEFPMLQRQLQKLARDYRKKQIVKKIAVLTCRKTKIPPREFVKHDTFSALAISMTLPVNIVTRQSVLPKVVASFTDSKIRRNLTCPLSTIAYPDVTFLKYKSSLDKVLTLDEIGIALEKGKQAQLIKFLSNRRRESQIEGIADNYRRSTMSTTTSQSIEIARQYSGKIKHYAESCFSLVMLPYALLPKSKLSVTWEILMCVLGLISCLTISLQGSFFISSPFLWSINYIIDAFFYIDVFLKLYTAYFNAEGILVTAPVKCAVNYFRTNFLLDMLSNFPTEIFALVFLNGDNFLTILSLLRLNRLVRAYKLVLLFEYLEDRVSILTSYYKVGKFIVFLAIGTHWIACYWFLVGCSDLTGSATQQIDGKYRCTRDGWALQETALTPFDSSDSTTKKYVTTLYWSSTTSTTVGYGDIIPYTDFEILYALSIMVVSVISYGYVLGSFAASLTNTNCTYSAFKEKVSAIKMYLKDNKVDSSIVKRVIKHYEYLWQKRKGVDLQDIFEGLPVSLKADLALNLHEDFIEKIPIFKNADAALLKLVALACKPVFFLSGQCILKKGDLGNAMYFISKGQVEIFSGNNDSIHIGQIENGNFFGEISCFLGCIVMATVKAKTNCDLFMLRKEDLMRCLRHYPHVADHMKTIAQERYNSIKMLELLAVLPDNGVHDNPDECSQSQNDEKRPKQFCFNQRMIIDPEDYVGLTISAVGHVLVLLTSLILPYQATFVDTTTILYIVTYLAESYFIIEVVLNFFTIKYDSEGNKITEIKKIVVSYLRKPNGFFLDLLLLMPFEVFAFTISNRHTRTVAFLWLRTHRIIRMLRLIPFIKADNQQFRTLMSMHFVAIAIQCGLLLTLSTHWCACLWYAIACPGAECRSGTWAYSAGITNSSDYHYLTSLYWSVTTLTTTGYGDISATNTLEMIISSSIMIMGKLLFGFILGNVASEISNWNKNEVEFKGKVAAVKKYMTQKKISPSLQAHVLEYLDYIWARKRNVHYHTLLNDMSFCMQAEIAMAGTERLLRKVPLFLGIDEAFLRRLSLTLKKFFYLPNQFIVVTRDINYDLYIIQEGNVRVYTDDSSHQTLLSSGGFFGLNSFYSKHQKEVTAIAINHVDMIVVRKTEFDHLVKLYPNAQEHLDSVLAYYGLLPSFGQEMDVLETTV